MRIKSLLTFAVVMTITLVVGIQPTQALPSSGYYYIMTRFTGTCSGTPGNVVISGSITRVAYLPAGDLNILTITGASTFSGPGSFGPIGPGATSTTIGFSSTPGPAPVWVKAVVDTSVGGSPIGSSTILITCNSESGRPVVALSNTYEVGVFQGPPLPEGFVLKTITCDVAVFDAPGGQPVGENRIKGGQTWYVNPTPKKDAAGKSWTEVFVAGYTNGYVPTSCVH